MVKKFNIFLVIVMILALLLSFGKIGDTVGGWFGVAAGKVSDIAKTVFMSALGVFLISSGVAALAVPFVGIALIVIGLVLVTVALWPVFTGGKKLQD